MTVTLLVTLPNGVRLDVLDSITQEWLAPSEWQVGSIVRVESWPVYLGPLQRGKIRVSAQVREGAPETLPTEDAAVVVTPETAASGDKPARIVEGGLAVLLEDVAVR